MEDIQEYIDDRIEFYQSELCELEGRYYKGVVPEMTNDGIYKAKLNIAIWELSKIKKMIKRNEKPSEGQRIVDWMCEDYYRRMDIGGAVYMGVNGALLKTKGITLSEGVLYEGDINADVIKRATFYEITHVSDILG